MPTEVEREEAGTYNAKVIHDHLVRMRVRALTFSPNLNGFMFKKPVLEREHATALGETVPAYKSFVSALVNRDHVMVDNDRGKDHVIGYVENSELHNDGVYLDLVLWKRCMSDKELSQIRENRVSVSMEVEYTAPVIQYSSGKEVAYVPGTPIPAGAIRTMSEQSTVSFVGIAVLFDGKRPADPKSKVIFAENAALTEEITTEISVIDSIVLPNSEGASMSKELEELRAELEAIKTAKEKAEASVQELHAQVQAKSEELEAANAKLQNTYTELEVKSAELTALKKQAFMANVSLYFDLDSMADGPKAFLLNLFDWYCYGCSDPMKFEDVAENLAGMAAAMKPMAPDTDNSAEEDAAATGEGEGSQEGESKTSEETPEPETHTEQEIANTENTETVADESATETETPVGDPAAVAAEGAPSAPVVPPATVEAAPISGASNTGWKFDRNLL